MEKLGLDKIFPAPPVPGGAIATMYVRAPRPGHLENRHGMIMSTVFLVSNPFDHIKSC